MSAQSHRQLLQLPPADAVGTLVQCRKAGLIEADNIAILGYIKDQICDLYPKLAAKIQKEVSDTIVHDSTPEKS